MNISKKIFILYIYLLPISLFPFFQVIRNYFSPSASIQNSFFIMCLGLLFLFLTHNQKLVITNVLLSKTLRLIIFLCCSTFIMSSVLYYKLGQLYGETTFTASLSSYIYLFMIFITFYYNSKMSENITVNYLDKIIFNITSFMIFIGYVQIMILIRIPIIGKIYDNLDIFNVLNSSEYITRINRIPLTGREPASVAIIVGCFILPFLLSKLLYKKEIKYLVRIFLLLPIVFYTYSSSVYLAIFINIVVFLLLSSKKRNVIKKSSLVLICLFSILIFMPLVLINVTGIEVEIFTTIKDLLFGKTTNLSNMSTGYRYTTVINSFHVFMDYPLLGVGTGNQGFFYNQNILSSPLVNSEILNSISTKSALAGQFGLMGGGAFVPDFISSYGTVGTISLIYYIKMTQKFLKNNNKIYHYYDFYIIGSLTFIVLAFATSSLYGNYLVMFLLSIPMMNFKHESH